MGSTLGALNHAVWRESDGASPHRPVRSPVCPCLGGPMSACCEPQGYDRIFDDREARRAASRYRRSGLASLPRRTVEQYRDGTISGDSLLEIGGGVGDLQIEMLKAGVRTAVGVDMSPAYDDVAAELLAEAGMTGRVERRTGDVVARPELAAPADVVVMHSVVCCYADVRGLLAV